MRALLAICLCRTFARHLPLPDLTVASLSGGFGGITSAAAAELGSKVCSLKWHAACSTEKPVLKDSLKLSPSACHVFKTVSRPLPQ